MDSSTPTSETGENVNLFFVFISSLVFFGVCIYVQYLLDAVRNQTSNKKHRPELIKKRSKVHGKNMSHEHALKSGSHLPKKYVFFVSMKVL